jgi:hypothetical protein
MNAQELAAKAKEYKEAYITGKLSLVEFKELVSDLNLAKEIDQNASQFEDDQQARTIILDVIQIVSAL